MNTADPSAAEPPAFWRRHGWLILLAVPLLSSVGTLYLGSNFATKAEVKTVEKLVYERTKATNDRVGSLEGAIQGIKTKLEERDRLSDDRARRAENDAADIKHDLRDIQAFLRTAPRK